MCENEPCPHCYNYVEYYDWDTGVTVVECKSKEGFWGDMGVSLCPNFRPILPTDHLFEEIWEEKETRHWEEEKKEMEKYKYA